MKNYEEFKAKLEDAVRKELPLIKEVVMDDIHGPLLDGTKVLENSSGTEQRPFKEMIEDSFTLETYNGVTAIDEMMEVMIEYCVLRIEGYETWIKRYGYEPD